MKLEEGEFINVVATVNLSSREGKILFVNPVKVGRQPTGEVKSDVQLRFMGPSDDVLETSTLEVKLDSCRDEDEGEQGLVDATVRKPEGTVRVELFIAGRLVDSFGGLPSVSQVRNVRLSSPAGVVNRVG